MSNIKDVAKKAGVGIATVSRVLNNSGYVKKETRERIERVIYEIGYVPNEIARSMTKQKTRIIAFIVPHSNHIFFSQLIYFVEKALYEFGHKLMVCNSGSNREKELDLINMLKNNRVDGLILLTSNDIENYIKPHLPIVSFDRRFKGIPFVASDNYEGGRLAAKKLLSYNPKKLLFIGDDAQGELSDIKTEVTKRRLGFVDYLKTQNFSNYSVIEYPLGDLFVPKNFLEMMIREHADVDGIFTISDMVAEVIINELKRLGKRIPEDIKVVGYDGVKGYLNLGLTISSIAQPTEELAKHLVEVLLQKIHGLEAHDIILPVSYVDGDTT